VILSNSEPTSEMSMINAGFFVFLFILIYSIMSLTAAIYSRLKGHEIYSFINRKFVLITIFIVGILVMSALQVLNYISAITFVIAIILLELFFASYKRNEK